MYSEETHLVQLVSSRLRLLLGALKYEKFEALFIWFVSFLL